jgi:hypothetical protein
MNLKWKLASAVGAIAIAGVLAQAEGLFPGWPVVGGASYCASYTNNGGSNICSSTVLPGPSALSDEEMIVADTGALNGVNPATVSIPSGMLGGLNLKHNRLVGGNMDTNLWQRGATPLTAASPTVAKLTADRWWAISANNVVTVSKQTPASTAADYLGTSGYYSWMRVARPSGTPSGVTCIGQTLDQEAAAPLIGLNAVFSFYGYAPTTFSATNQNITATVAYFTAADAAATQAAIQNAGGNSSTFALSASGQTGGITGYAAATAGPSGNYPGTVASNVVTIGLTQTPTRYSVYAPIPSANAAGTAVTAVGVAICATPTLTTTVTTDYFEVTGLQLQAMPGTASAQLPNGITSPTGFERRGAVFDALNQYYYSYVVNESASVVNYRAICGMSSTSLANCNIPFPVAMRIAPNMKYTAGFEASTTTASVAAAACTALTTSATLTGSAATLTGVLVDCASSAAFSAAGSAGFLWDSGSVANGVISASAEP